MAGADRRHVSGTLVCPSCGAENPGDFAFCGRCGARFVATPVISEERKTVTTLFCDLVAFTAMSEAADPEDVDALLGDYFARATRVIESHGGTVEKFIGDAVVGVFGVPQVHEDDPERAVRAALRILEALEGMTRPDGTPLEARCGVNTGEALVRLDVDPASGRGFLTGDAVNTAARLEAAAPPGGVAVGALTHELTERVIVYEELPPVMAKGKAELVPTWLAQSSVARTGATAASACSAPLVGRNNELATLRALLDTAISTAEPQVVLLVGEPGIGKTRLVQELYAHVDARPDMVTWRQGSCPSYGEGGVSYSALADIVRAHAGLMDTDDPATAAGKLAAAVPSGSDVAWMVNRLRALVGLEAPLAEREENFTAWLRFLEYLASTEPAVLVIEDLHWADEGLLAFLRYLSGNARAVPLLVVGTARRELLEAHPDFASTVPGLTCIDVGPLTRTETERLVAEVLRDSPARGEAVADLIVRCDGNPFFAVESARLLGDQRLEASVPASVHAVIAARLDSLPVEQKNALASAAVIGEIFWDGAVAELGGDDRDLVSVELSALEDKGFVRSARDSSIAGECEWAFAHALARDVAYGALPRRVRAEKHALAGGWLEGRASERLEEVADLLAYHRMTAFELAEAVRDLELAEEYRGHAATALMLAGKRTMRLDVEAAERQLARAVEVSSEHDVHRAELMHAWARALLYEGRHREARPVYEESVRCFLARGLRSEAAVAMVELEKALYWLGEEDWRAVLEAALQLTDEEPDCEARALVMTALGGAEIALADYPSGLEWVKRARDIYIRRGMQVPLDLQGWQIQAECGLGDADAAGRLLQNVRAMREAGIGRETAIGYVNSGGLLFQFQGPRAFNSVEEGLQFLESRGISEGRGLLLVNRCSGLISAGRWEEALSRLHECHEWLEQRDDKLCLGYWWQNKASVLVDMGRPPEALACAEEAHKRAQTWEYHVLGAGADAVLALALAAVGELDRAMKTLATFAEVTRQPGAQGDEDGIPGLMRCALRCGRIDIAGGLLEGVQPGIPLLDLARASGHALLAEAQGERAAAAAGFAAAAKGWQDFGVPNEEGHALFGQGRCLAALGRPDEAVDPLNAARDIFARLGAAPALAETDEWLGRIAL